MAHVYEEDIRLVSTVFSCAKIRHVQTTLTSRLLGPLSNVNCLICCTYRMEYPGVSPELSFLKETGRVESYSVTDQEAVDGKQLPIAISIMLIANCGRSMCVVM